MYSSHTPSSIFGHGYFNNLPMFSNIILGNQSNKLQWNEWV